MKRPSRIPAPVFEAFEACRTEWDRVNSEGRPCGRNWSAPIAIATDEDLPDGLRQWLELNPEQGNPVKNGPRIVYPRKPGPEYSKLLTDLADNPELPQTWINLEKQPIAQIAELLAFLVEVRLGFDDKRPEKEKQVIRKAQEIANTAQQLYKQIGEIQRLAIDGDFPVLANWKDLAKPLPYIFWQANRYPDDLPNTVGSAHKKRAIVMHYRACCEHHQKVREATPAYRQKPALPILGHADIARLLSALFPPLVFEDDDIRKAKLNTKRSRKD